jgi:hypothetical protein
MKVSTTEPNLYNIIQPIPTILIWGGVFVIFTLITKPFVSLDKYTILFGIFALVFGCLFVYIVFWIYCFCLGGQNVSTACKLTAIIISFTLVPTCLLLIKSEFVNVFANSIGYLYYSFRPEVKEIFSFAEDKLNENTKFTPSTSVLLTLFNDVNDLSGDITKFNNGYSKDEPFKLKDIPTASNGTNKDFDKLKGIVSGKNIIGMLCWFYIATVFTSIISIKYLSTI